MRKSEKSCEPSVLVRWKSREDFIADSESSIALIEAARQNLQKAWEGCHEAPVRRLLAHEMLQQLSIQERRLRL